MESKSTPHPDGPNEHGQKEHGQEGHSQEEHSHEASSRRLMVVLALVVAFMAAEVVGGILSGSLALLADAGHMLSDAASLALALFAMRLARRSPTRRRTFGYHRAEILAALLNGATLVAIAVFIVIEAWGRFQDPPEVNGGMMMVIAAGGLVINLIGLAVLHGRDSESLNMQGVWLHVLSDTLGSLQALVAGGLILWRGWTLVDPIASVLIACLVAWSAWSLLTRSVDVLMESMPEHIDFDQLKSVILEVDGVTEVHDLHAWTITSGLHSLSAHVRRTSDCDPAEVLREIRERLEAQGLDHVTIQLEPQEFAAESEQVCDPPEPR